MESFLAELELLFTLPVDMGYHVLTYIIKKIDPPSKKSWADLTCLG